jgi:sulfur-oxidizing protein SoxX
MDGSIQSQAKRLAERAWFVLVAALVLMGRSENFVGAQERLLPYKIVGDAIPVSLTGNNGDAARGRAIVVNRQKGLCLLCHSGPFPEERFQGNLAPDLKGVGYTLVRRTIATTHGRQPQIRRRHDHAELLQS